MNKRLFIAVDVSEQTRSLIRAIQSELHFFKNNIRFVSPQNVHVTLKFLGDVPSDQILPVISKVESCVSSFQIFNYICEGTGVFPNIKKPRVLWLGITEGSENLRELSWKLNDSLRKLPVQQEDKEYRSHITLGRVKHYNYRENNLNLSNFLAMKFEKTINNVAEMVLYESFLRPKGAIYKAIHKFKLK